MRFLTPGKQYGIMLAFSLVLSQGFAYLLAENISFRQQMIGAKTTNSLIGLVYQKQLRVSAATNKEFVHGEIITFVQVDAQKMQWLSQ